jgi:cation:H+ antiporter
MLDNVLSRLDGAILLVIFFLYMYMIIHKNKSTEIVNNVQYTDVFKNFGIFFFSILLLLGSAEFLVRSAKEISIELNLPILLIGLFVVAIGTSLPELVYGSRAILLKHKEQALGDIMGSIVANSTAVLGITAIITPIVFNFSLFLISSAFMIFALFIFMTFIRSGSVITWREGVALLMLYVLFIIVQFYIQGLPIT